MFVTGNSNLPSHMRQILTRPQKGLVHSPPWGRLQPLLGALCVELFSKLLNTIYTFFGNSVDPDQLASDKFSWSGSTRFSILRGLKLDLGQVHIVS